MIDWVSQHIPPWFWIAFIVHLGVLGTVAYLILLERKTASWVQDRIGPNRVGLLGLVPFLPENLRNKHMLGLGQPLADGLKFILKEDYAPRNVDKYLFTLAPGIMILVIIVSIAVIPWGGTRQGYVAIGSPIPAGAVEVARDTNQGNITYQWDFQIAGLNIGVLFVIVFLSLAVYGVVVGGWASNNKYSFLGGLRATANMISYEIPLGLCILCIVLMFGTLDLGQIVAKQAHYWFGVIPAWNVFTQPLAFLLFLVCLHAEANRAPFDLAEAEQELVGGYHTEYSSMRFALFFLAEYAGMVTTSCVCVALFFGGWHIPWLDKIHAIGGYVDVNNPAVTDSLLVCILRAIVFFTKALAILFVFMWVRWSLPRFRFDQLMDIAWRGFIPISLGLMIGTALLIWKTAGETLNGVTPAHAGWFLLMNLAVLGGTIVLSRLIPAPPPTNRRLKVMNSRFAETPVPANV
jgi:NADH-quinone oxidoreductase subunit H